jgi:glycosyltransferase involved in cell wall biosynthesis
VETVLPFQWGYWRFLRQIVRVSRDADAVVLRGTSGFSEGYGEAVAAVLIKLRWRHPPLLLVSDASWDLTSGALEKRLPAFAAPALRRLGRLGVRAADGRHVVYGVLSTDEERAFKQRWGIDEDRVRFTPFYATVPEATGEGPSSEGYVFAGGNTHRDYPLLADAAKGLDVPVRIASSWQPPRPLPANVEVSAVPQDEYNRLMQRAGVVVVPLLRTARSVGHQTYLSAMRMGKAVIITDAPGVSDYVVPGETAMVVDSDPGALRAAIIWALDPANEPAVKRMTEKGRQAVEENYLARHYFARLWDLATEEAASRSRPRPDRAGTSARPASAGPA